MLPSPKDVRSFRLAVERGIPEPLLPGPEVDDLFRRVERADACLAELSRGRLTVALFGGTGVGKSTLLNALAGAVISSPGERRPTTDRVVCYRHRDLAVPDWLSSAELSEPPPPPHAVDQLAGLVLLDLPDTDSRAAEHRAIVHRLVPRLDVLIVVTSVDKYGDRALYDELAALPQAPRNLLFALNATDRLEPRYLEPVVGDFKGKLREISRLDQAELYAFSARRAFESPGHPEDQGFRELVARIEALGQAPERIAALTANAELALEEVRTAWLRAAPADEIDSWLQALRRVRTEIPASEKPTIAALERHLAEVAGSWAADRALRESWFPIGPIYFLLRKTLRRRADAQGRAPFPAGGDPCVGFAERALTHPLRLAAHQARSVLHSRRARLSLSLPEPGSPQADVQDTAVSRWWELLDAKSRRSAWKVRQHVPPLLAVVAWLGWIAAAVAPGRPEGASLLGTLLTAAWRALFSLSPFTVAVAVGTLALYYLLVYPYFLYRLERRMERESKAGAQIYVRSWEAEFEERWGKPFRERLEAAEVWWAEAGRAFRRISPPP